jgi:hypothetical protein
MAVMVDRDESRRFRDELADYLTCVVARDGSFCCPSADCWCRGSIARGHHLAEGQLSYVGDAYATHDAGQDLRILVVSMQVGDAEAPVTMSRRREQVRVRIPEQPKDRNAHMRGVTYALQLLFGREPGPRDEHLDDGTHVLDAYAMANSTLCSNLPTGGVSRRGEPTSVMLRRCSEHLRRTIEILRPTVIQTQGRKRTGHSTHSAFEAIVDDYMPLTEWNARVRIGGIEAVWCSLPHPSSGPPHAWQWPSTVFFRDVVSPSLREARRLALDGAG